MRDIIRRGERVTTLVVGQSDKGGAGAARLVVAPDDTPSEEQAREPGAVLAALRARSRAPQQPPPDAGRPRAGDNQLSALEDRVREMDDGLAKLRTDLQQPALSMPAGVPASQWPPEIKDLVERLKANVEEFRDQAEHLRAIERRLEGLTRAPPPEGPPENRWEGTVDGLTKRIDKRLDTLDRHLASVRDQAREFRDRDQEWTQNRLRRLSRSLGFGLAVLGLLTAGLFGLDWWRAERRLDRLEGIQSAQTLRLNEDLNARLARIEQVAAELQQDKDQSTRLAAGLAGKIESLARGQEALSRRLDGLSTRDPSEADNRGAGTQSPAQSDKVMSAGLSVIPDEQRPAASAEDRYSIQLISFRNKSSVEPFMHRFGISEEARYLRERSRGREWYSVLLGDYRSYDEAAIAAEHLPPELKELEPTIRSVPPGTSLSPID